MAKNRSFVDVHTAGFVPMAKDRRYGYGNSGAGSGMHLFDFNETLSARRLLEDKRIAMEMQMERFYRAKATVESATPRHSGARREDAEMIRNALRSSEKKTQQHVLKEPKAIEKQRGPNVVARLMGLDTLPAQPAATKAAAAVPADKQQPSKKKKGPEMIVLPPLDMVEKKSRKMSPQTKEHQRFRPQEHQAVTREPDMAQLQEMQRQLAVKQMLVREKLNEAKRLLTDEKLSDNKWHPANEKINQSKQFLDAVDFFQNNRDAFLGYLDEHDAVLHGQLQRLPGTTQHATERVPPDGMGNPIVRRVIEERRNDELRLFLNRQTDMAKVREQPSVNQVPTRIVVLKPNPSKNAPSRPVASLSPRSYSDVKDLIEAARPQTSSKKGEGANPREIAKEIARQVRENVVRDLARSEEQVTDKRIDGIPKPSFTSDYSRAATPTVDDNLPKSTRATSPENQRVGGTSKNNNKLKARVPLDQVPEDYSRKLMQSVPKKTMRVSRQASGSCPPAGKPGAKGIVVLVPDGARASEAQGRGETTTDIRKQSLKKDSRGQRRGQQPETPIHKHGDSFRRRPIDPVKPEAEECRIEEAVERRTAEAIECGIEETNADTDKTPVSSTNSVLGYGGSFLLRNAETCSSDTRAMEEFGFTADYGTEDLDHTRTQSDNSLLHPVSSTGSQHYEPPSAESPSTIDKDGISDSLDAAREFEISEAASPIKDCPVLTDGEPTSANGDTSGQPSPVSVLDSSFEDSPSPVDYETISSELEELRLHLSRLKWDPSQDQDDAASPVDKVVLETDTEPELSRAAVPFSETDTELASTAEFSWLELECLYTGDLPCPPGAKQDQAYVKMVLLGSGLTSNDDEHARVAETLDSSLFERLEDYYRMDQPGKSSRRLLFDLVNEILGERCQKARTELPAGRFLLAEVWTKICDYYEYPQGEDLQGTVEMLIEKYMSKGDKWIDVQANSREIGVQIEGKIFRDLLDDTVDSLFDLVQ